MYEQSDDRKLLDAGFVSMKTFFLEVWVLLRDLVCHHILITPNQRQKSQIKNFLKLKPPWHKSPSKFSMQRKENLMMISLLFPFLLMPPSLFSKVFSLSLCPFLFWPFLTHTPKMPLSNTRTWKVMQKKKSLKLLEFGLLIQKLSLFR